MTGPTVLVVDDNALNLKLTRTLLVTHGYQVQTAASGSEALEALQTFVPQMILLDLQMPVMDGFELARRLKQDPRLRDVVLIALTAYAMKGDEARALAAGCDGYIAKPIDTRALPLQLAAYLTS